MISAQRDKTTARVAAVQIQARLGQIQTNLDHYLPYVDQAAREGAQLIVLPELAACGYSLSSLLWDSAETRDGVTVRWLQAAAERFRVYLGIGFIEAEGDDFYNAYALAAPDGTIAGFVRKTMAEVNLFHGAAGSHVIDTTLGNIGVGICADVHFVPFVASMQARSVDLLLMPHAWPGSYKTGGAVSQADIERTNAKARTLAPLYARFLGVPVVLANLVGDRGPEPWGGLTGRLMDPAHTRFLGVSTIADWDGTVLQQMDGVSEGILVADVTLDPRQKVTASPKKYGRYGGGWIDKGQPSDIVRDLLCSVDAFFGQRSYTHSDDRRRKACRISANQTRHIAVHSQTA